ncbi:hypothetical protein ACVWZ4_003871 [Bradyrhizobium sp. USDA 4472]
MIRVFSRNVQQNVQHFVQHVSINARLLTRRHGTWQFVRRLPIEFAKLDRRRIIKHSTRIKIADDRAGRRAVRVAQQLNEQLEIFWKGLANGHRTEQLHSYETVRQRTRSLGFEYIEHEELLRQPPEARLQRLEALVAKGGGWR